MEKELTEIFESVKRAADAAENSPGEEDLFLDALKRLKKFPVNYQVLVSTKVRKRLRQLTKHRSERIKALASDVVEMWKSIIVKETMENKKNGTVENGDSVKAESAGTETNEVKNIHRTNTVKAEQNPAAKRLKVDNVKDEEKLETDKATEDSVKAAETNPVEELDNVVLRKLLRGPRYFDPPDSSWGACYNCGEEGHTTVNCTSAKRKKPCFVCGSFEHNAKQCSKGRDCFICKQQGHCAKDCPEKYKSSKICLKCGDLGHEMFSCRNDYCPEDLKEIQCYICGKFGHLCCINYNDPGPREVTCYRCGLAGHTGLACMGSRGHTYTNDIVSSYSCYKCGLEGHFARECTSSMKAGKRNREPSTPKQRSSKNTRDHMNARSAPHDLGKTGKKKKSQYDEFISAAKTKHRGGWITEDPGDCYYYSNNSKYNWRSQGNLSDRRAKAPIPYGDYASNSHSSKKPRKVNFNDSPASGSRHYQHRYSASRFGNDSYDGMGRNNNWW